MFYSFSNRYPSICFSPSMLERIPSLIELIVVFAYLSKPFELGVKLFDFSPLQEVFDSSPLWMVFDCPAIAGEFRFSDVSGGF